MGNAPVAFVDCETTGLDPDRHEIWEVGLILPDGSEHEWQLPVDLSRADPIGLAKGRFHERRWQQDRIGVSQLVNGRWHSTPPNFANSFVRLTRGLHLCGAVVSFDADRLWRLLRASGECPMWHYHLIDVEALAAGFIAGSRAALAHITPSTGEAYWAGTRTLAAAEGPDAQPPWNSNDLSRAVGVNPDDFDRHTALGDARWAAAIYKAVMGG